MAREPQTANFQKNSGGAFWVAFGIFLSRIAGLIREKILAHYLGNSPASDAFKAALRIPNFLQNLFGEGVLSASFIPVYAGLLSTDAREAQRLARAVGTLLTLLVSLLVLIGVLLTPQLIQILAPGFGDDRRDLTIELVRIMFPGIGLLVISAWCLGVLNSHRKFFLSYVAPVFLNLAVIAAVVFTTKGANFESIAIRAAWGMVLGSLLQLVVQVPVTYKLLGHFAPNFDFKQKSVRTVLKNFSPALMGRGVVQISAYIDTMIASFLPTGAVSTIAYSQTLYLLPVSLFGMSISASELPAMSSEVAASGDVTDQLRKRLAGSLARIRFFVIPSAVAFLFVGDSIATLIFQGGSFRAEDSLWVWKTLGAMALGLVATTQSRLFASTFYAQKDTRTPLKIALIRVSVGIVLGIGLVFGVARTFNLAEQWGTSLLGLSSAITSWVEYSLLRRALTIRIGKFGEHKLESFKVWGSAVIGALLAWTGKLFLNTVPMLGSAGRLPWLGAALILVLFSLGFAGSCWMSRNEIFMQLLKRRKSS